MWLRQEVQQQKRAAEAGCDGAEARVARLVALVTMTHLVTWAEVARSRASPRHLEALYRGLDREVGAGLGPVAGAFSRHLSRGARFYLDH